MKTITITLNKTLADLQKEEGVDFGYDCDNPEEWFVINWRRPWKSDAVYATCCDSQNNLLTFEGE